MSRLLLRIALVRSATPQAAIAPHGVPRAFACFGTALLAFLFFGGLGTRDLTSSHEARAAQNAQRMLDTGAWALPVLFDGQTDFQKPPGYYWLVAALGWINGGSVTAVVARLPAAIAGLITVLAVFAFLFREGRPTAAVIAAVALATAIHFTAIARTARIDVPLTCAVALSLLAFHRGCTSSSRRLGWHAASAIAAACGVMLKGPVALALIGPAAVLWLMTTRSAKLPLASAILGIGVLATLAGPWFVWANAATDGEFGRVFFWHHNVERFNGASATLASHPWWYYVPRFVADFLPWSPAFALLVAWSLHTRQLNDDAHAKFGLIGFSAMFLVLSAAQFKRADYLLPLYPGAAIAFGCLSERWLESRANPQTIRRARTAFASVAAAVAIGWPAMIFVIEPRAAAKDEKRAFATAIRELAPPPQEVMLFRTESHLLAWHLGRPILTRVEWHDLNAWLALPGPHVVVMPPEYAYAAQQIVTSRKLIVVAGLSDYTTAAPARPLVILRTAD